MSSSRWLLAAILGSALAAPAAAQRPAVVKLGFEGNAAFTRSELASAIVIQPPSCRLPLLCWFGIGTEPASLAPGVLEADAARLNVYYFERGYREAQITPDTTRVGDDEVEVTFRIEEGRPVRVTDVLMEGLPEGLDRQPLPLRVGEPFDVVAYEATRDTLQNRLWNGGWPRGQVLVGYTIRRESPYEASVRYTVYPGVAARFGEIRVEGTEEISPDLVHRMLAFDPGERYDRSALLESQRNLYGLQIFRQADIQADTESAPDSLVPVSVRVSEGNMHRVRLGGGLNNVECTNVEGQWTSRNFLGDGRRLSVRGRLGNMGIDQCGWLVSDDIAYDGLTGLASVDFTQPWFFGPRNSIGVGLFFEKRNVPQVFTRTAWGGYVALSRSLGRNATATLAYRPELTDLETENQLYFCINLVACSVEAIADLSTNHWLAPVTLSFTMDRTDALFTPSEGYIVRLDLEYAARFTGSDFSYTRFLGEASRYWGERDGAVLATRIRAGAGFPHKGRTAEALGLNPQKRFFAGGANSVRGFDQFRLGPTVLGIDAVPWLVNGDDPQTDEVEGAGCAPATLDVDNPSCDANGLPDRVFDVRPSGGQVLLEGNIELRFPLPVAGGHLRGAVFVDAGQVWRDWDGVDLGTTVATPGFGLRYQSPIGPIRVDAAFNPQGVRDLTVLTTTVEGCYADDRGCRKVEHNEPRDFVRNAGTVIALDPLVSFGESLDAIDSFGDFIKRFQLHFSIGQAF